MTRTLAPLVPALVLALAAAVAPARFSPFLGGMAILAVFVWLLIVASRQPMSKARKSPPKEPSEADHRNSFWLRVTEAGAGAREGYKGRSVTTSMIATAHEVGLAWTALARELERMR